jgi:hypothetical protein
VGVSPRTFVDLLRSSSVFVDLRNIFFDERMFDECSTNIRRTFVEHSPNIRRTFVEHSPNIRRTFVEHSPNIRRTFVERSAKGRRTANVRRTFGEKNVAKVDEHRRRSKKIDERSAIFAAKHPRRCSTVYLKEIL